MSGHLMIVAGYLELPASHKLALIKLCDSADDRTRLAFPGLDAVRMWAGLSKSRAIEVMNDLQDWGLIMQTEKGRRGRRATFKVFPAPGDELHSVAHKEGKPCPGMKKFGPVPPIPSNEDVIAWCATRDQPKQKGSGQSDPNADSGKGPASRTQSAKGSDPEPGKGPIQPEIGSDAPDPFPPTLPPSSTSTTTDSFANAQESAGSADADPAGQQALDGMPKSEKPNESATATDGKPTDPARHLVDRYWNWLIEQKIPVPAELGEERGRGTPWLKCVSMVRARLKRGWTDAEISCALAALARKDDVFPAASPLDKQLLRQRREREHGSRRAYVDEQWNDPEVRAEIDEWNSRSTAGHLANGGTVPEMTDEELQAAWDALGVAPLEEVR